MHICNLPHDCIFTIICQIRHREDVAALFCTNHYFYSFRARFTSDPKYPGNTIRCFYEWDGIKKFHRIVCHSVKHQFNLIATENLNLPNQFRILTIKNIKLLAQILINKKQLRFVQGVFSEEQKEAIIDNTLDVYVEINEQNGLIQNLSFLPNERNCIYKEFKILMYHYENINTQIENYYKYFSDTLINTVFGDYVKLIFQILLSTATEKK